MVRELEAWEAHALSKMLRVIRKSAYRNKVRKNLYDSKTRLEKIGFSVPPHMIDFQTPLGWAEKSVSVPAARIRREGFRFPFESSLNDDLQEIFGGRYTARLEAGVNKSSLRYGPAFMFVNRGDESAGDPKVVFSARSALEATCIQNPRTAVVEAALELEGNTGALLYFPGVILSVENFDGRWLVVGEYRQPHNLVLCEPFVWDWDLDRPFGRSRITRPLIGAIESGVRTLLRMEVTAEFFSAPQRALMGASEEHFTDKDGKPIDIWKAITGGVWALPDTYDEDEDKTVRAQLQQLSQASMTPHGEMIEKIALRASSEMSMPVGYLGVLSAQPQAEGAIKASEVDMVALIEYQIEQSYKTASENLARKALAVFHDGMSPAMDLDLRKLSARYAKPGTPTESARSDAALKYTTAFPDGDPALAMEMYGLTEEQIERNLAYARRNAATSLLSRLNLSGDSSAEPLAPVTADADQ